MFNGKKNVLVVSIAAVLAFGVAASKAEAKAKTAGECRVAVVDVQKIVDSSPTINALKTEMKNKLAELNSFVENARADVTKQSDDTKKKALEDKYNQEFNVKKNAIEADYVKKMSAVDKDVTALIKSKAHAAGYNLVLTKITVIDGGDDITNDIIRALK